MSNDIVKAAVKAGLERGRIPIATFGLIKPPQLIDNGGTNFATASAQALFPRCGNPLIAKTNEEYSAFVLKFFRDAFEEYRISLEDIHPFRIILAWRFSREVLRIALGEKTRFQPLMILLSDDEIDRWKELDPAEAPPNRNAKEGSYLYRIRAALLGGEHLLGVGPPPVPAEHITKDGELADSYDIDRDGRLNQWLRVFTLVAWKLRFGEPPEENPRLGELSFRGLDNIEWIRFLWPKRHEVVQFEELLLEEVALDVADNGLKVAAKNLRSRYGLTLEEAGYTTELAFSWLKGTLGKDTEEQRLLVASRLEQISNRAKGAGDLRGELMAVKQMASVLGVTKSTPQDDVANFIEAVSRVASEGKKLKAPE